jgi:hypothetical protein
MRSMPRTPGPESVTSVAPTLERHFTPRELAELWNLSPRSIIRLFDSEPGVLIIERAATRARTTRHRTLRIPQGVAERVHRRISNVSSSA